MQVVAAYEQQVSFSFWVESKKVMDTLVYDANSIKAIMVL